MRYKEDYILPVTIGVCVLLIVLGVYLVYIDEVRWQKFKKEHNCILIHRTSATVVTGTTSDGKIATTTIPSKEIYRCDDGMTYER